MPDYTFTQEDTLPKTPTQQWNANIAAIGAWKKLEAEGDRAATDAEQAVLAQYSGFGNSAFEQAFKPADANSAWGRRGTELKGLVTPEQYSSIERSRLNAFYTSPEVVRAMWQGLEEMGAGQMDNPVVLEPSAGSGRFLGMQPEGMAKKSTRKAVELDDMTGRILSKAYPDTQVYITGFQDAAIPDNSVDIAISNIPFGDFGVFDSGYEDSGKTRLTQQIHNYFFAKGLDKMKPGGTMAFITSHYTMDSSQARDIRSYLVNQGGGEFLGAVRLPSDAFPDTDVITDVIYMRKRLPGEEPDEATHNRNRQFIETGNKWLPDKDGRDRPHNVSSYFAQNPDNVLGKETSTGSMRGGQEYTVVSDGAINRRMATQTKKIAAVAPNMVTSARDYKSHLDSLRLNQGAETQVRRVEGRSEGEYYVDNTGTLRVVEGGESKAPSFKAKGGEERVRGMLQLGASATKLMDLERQSDASDEDVENSRATLAAQYEEFESKYGKVNDKTNVGLIRHHPDAYLVRGLETWQDDEWMGNTILKQRVIGREHPVTAQNSQEAVVASLNKRAAIDTEYIGELLGQTPDEARVKLLADGVVYEHPVTNELLTPDRYLSGDVREKLIEAEQIAKSYPRFQRNIEALKAVTPDDLDASQIRASLGAPWVPDEYINQYIQESLNLSSRYGKFYEYNDTTGRWEPNQKIPDVGTTRAVWGTKMADAATIMKFAMQNRPILIKEKDSEGKEVTLREATVEAQNKVDQVRKDFSEWVWQEPERAAELVEIYNRDMNNLVPRRFDGGNQTFPRMSGKWQKWLRSYQRDGIARVVQDGTTLLAHEVGLGKTATMVAGGMERKRLGLSKVPMYVIPVATYGQFAQQFKDIYPDAKLLLQEGSDEQSRKTFLARAQTNDWDAVILTYDQFYNIPVREETDRRWFNIQKAEMVEALKSSERGSLKHKEIEKALERADTALQKRIRDHKKRRDEGGIFFEDLDVDQLFVDEADNFKNLGFVTQMENVKGLNPTSASKRAWDMFLKTQYIQDKLGTDTNDTRLFAKGGVVFATGTPLSNTLAEAWTMMRYLQRAELERRGLGHFDAWASTYGVVGNGIEQSAAGKYKETSRFSKWQNLPEFSALLQNVTDIRVASETPEVLQLQPRLVDSAGEGSNKRVQVSAPTYPPLERYKQHIYQRADNLGNVPPEEDNMLKIASDARKASLDIRMVNDYPADGPPPVANPESKIVKAAENVARIYKEEEADKGTQLIFLDMGTPKADKQQQDGAETTKEDESEDFTDDEQELLRDAYALIRSELEERGVKKEDIAFIHDYKKVDDRNKLFTEMRDGTKRVLVGSTQKLGVGVNVQDRAAALHHIDVPWRPRDVEQREGRIIRPGNHVYGPELDAETGKKVLAPGKGVKIYNYVQEGSFDEFMWQAIEKKSAGIKALMKRTVTTRESEDIDPLTMSAAEAKALASGDPRAVRLENLKNELTKLRLERAAHSSQQANATAQVGILKERVRTQQGELHKGNQDVAVASKLITEHEEATKGGKVDKRPLSLTVGREKPENRVYGDAAIRAAMTTLAYKGEWRKVGEYKGFDLEANKMDTGYQISLISPTTKRRYASSSIKADEMDNASLLTRADNVIKNIPAQVDKLAESLDENEKAYDLYEKQRGAPFPQRQELSALENEYRTLETEITGITASGVATADELEPRGAAEDFVVGENYKDTIAKSSQDDIAKARTEVMGEITAEFTGGAGFTLPTEAEIERRVAEKIELTNYREQSGVGDDVVVPTASAVAEKMADATPVVASASSDVEEGSEDEDYDEDYEDEDYEDDDHEYDDGDPVVVNAAPAAYPPQDEHDRPIPETGEERLARFRDDRVGERNVRFPDYITALDALQADVAAAESAGDVAGINDARQTLNKEVERILGVEREVTGVLTPEQVTMLRHKYPIAEPASASAPAPAPAPEEVSEELTLTRSRLAYNREQLGKTRAPTRRANIERNIAGLEEKENALLLPGGQPDTVEPSVVQEKGWDDRVIMESVAQLPDKLAGNQALQNAIAHSSEQNQRAEFDSQLKQMIAAGVRTDTALYKLYTEDAEFKEYLDNKLFNEVKEKASGPKVIITTAGASDTMPDDAPGYPMAGEPAGGESDTLVIAVGDPAPKQQQQEPEIESQTAIDASVNLDTLKHALKIGSGLTPINPVEVERYADRVQADIEAGNISPDMAEEARTVVSQGRQKLEAYHDVTLSNPKLRQRQQRELTRMANALADPRRAGQQEELIASFKNSFSSGSPTSQKLVEQIIEENTQSGKRGAWSVMQRAVGGSDKSARPPLKVSAPVNILDMARKEESGGPERRPDGTFTYEPDLESKIDIYAANRRQVMRGEGYNEETIDDHVGDLRQFLSDKDPDNIGEVATQFPIPSKGVDDDPDLPGVPSDRHATREEIVTRLDSVREEISKRETDSPVSRRLKGEETVLQADLDDTPPDTLDAPVPEQPTPDVAPVVSSLVTAPDKDVEEYGKALTDPDERTYIASEKFSQLSEGEQLTFDKVQEYLGDTLDEYDLAIVAERLGADATREEIEGEVARIQRQDALNKGQGDMFGATADMPDTLVAPEPVAPETELKQPSRFLSYEDYPYVEKRTINKLNRASHTGDPAALDAAFAGLGLAALNKEVRRAKDELKSQMVETPDPGVAPEAVAPELPLDDKPIEQRRTIRQQLEESGEIGAIQAEQELRAELQADRELRAEREQEAQPEVSAPAMDADLSDGLDVPAGAAPTPTVKVADLQHKLELCETFGKLNKSGLRQEVASTEQALVSVADNAGLDLNKLPAGTTSVSLGENGELIAHKDKYGEFDVGKVGMVSSEPDTPVDTSDAQETPSQEPQDAQEPTARQEKGTRRESPAGKWNALTQAEKATVVAAINQQLRRLTVAKAILHHSDNSNVRVSVASMAFCAVLGDELAMMMGDLTPAAQPTRNSDRRVVARMPRRGRTASSMNVVKPASGSPQGGRTVVPSNKGPGRVAAMAESDMPDAVGEADGYMMVDAGQRPQVKPKVTPPPNMMPQPKKRGKKGSGGGGKEDDGKAVSLVITGTASVGA